MPVLLYKMGKGNEMPTLFTMRSIHVSLEIWGAIFCLIMAFSMYLSKNFPVEKRKLLILLDCSIAVLLSMDAVAWTFRGTDGTLGYWMVRISNFFVFLMSDELMLVYHLYLCSYFPDKKKAYPVHRSWMVCVMGILAMLLVILSQFTGWYYYFDARNVYHRSFLHPLAMTLPLIGMLIDLSILIQYRKKLRKEIFWSMLSYIVLPIIGTILLIFYYGISLVNISLCISSVFLFIVAIMEQNRIMEEKEKEAYDLKVTIMLSQIRPHFIYNTLTTIKHLCKNNPQQAAETIDEFAVYLRGNLDSLMAKKLISFRQELEHTKNYLAIEKKRFGDRIQVSYEIEEEHFLVPSLILQPLVENAVKHGIMPKEEGGTIQIKTRKEGSDYYITVADDGVGFDMENQKKDGRSHIGIENTGNRLQSMCDGELYVTSHPGKGTTAVIRISAGGRKR